MKPLGSEALWELLQPLPPPRPAPVPLPRSQAAGFPQDLHRHPLRPQNGYRLGRSPHRTRLRLRPDRCPDSHHQPRAAANVWASHGPSDSPLAGTPPPSGSRSTGALCHPQAYYMGLRLAENTPTTPSDSPLAGTPRRAAVAQVRPRAGEAVPGRGHQAPLHPRVTARWVEVNQNRRAEPAGKPEQTTPGMEWVRKYLWGVQTL
jgi:hypothetical protein